ncbi:MAG TPA: homoserine dehydrogenase [Candidatus Enterococcus avicola]|uniref:Homoserine dehydrogenase n=1 Tax=Candidatus Enterococcus avicola TaxID=2838561 RepID=A0A9D2F5E6_9ENTE|nr:homoserine dehydrogenase [Candidatus Enterococcus avicola]
MKKEMKIGLLGLGVVATGVVERLAAQKKQIEGQTGVKLTISKALVLDTVEKAAFASAHGFELTTKLEDITENTEIDIVIELIGRISPAKEYILTALKNGKHVVTANKDLIAQHGQELIEVAKAQNVGFYYEASVGGGIPLLRPLATSYAADTITSVKGIVNGTTNYMLTKMMEDQLDYQTALEQAQNLGFAESDPTNDVDGIDAAYKMIILGAFAFGAELKVTDLAIQGIRNVQAADVKVAQSLGYEVKLIGEVKQVGEGVTASVSPVLVAKNHPLAMIKNEYNGVFIESKGIGQSLLYGPGAGALPTATSVLADLVEIADRTQGKQDFAPFNRKVANAPLVNRENVKENYFISVSLVTSAIETEEFVKGLVEQGYRVVYKAIDTKNNRLSLIVNHLTPTDYQTLLTKLATQGMIQGQLGVMGDFNEN